MPSTDGPVFPTIRADLAVKRILPRNREASRNTSARIYR